MIIYKCDRCGSETTNDNETVDTVKAYSYNGMYYDMESDNKYILNVMLCKKCLAEFKTSISYFMKMKVEK